MTEDHENTVNSPSPKMQTLYVGSNTPAKGLAGAIAHALREDSAVAIQAIGAGAVNQMVKSLAVARSYMQAEDKDLNAYPEMVDVDIYGKMKTAIRITALIHESERKDGYSEPSLRGHPEED